MKSVSNFIEVINHSGFPIGVQLYGQGIQHDQTSSGDLEVL